MRDEIINHLKNIRDFYKEIHDEDLSKKVGKYYTKKKLEKIQGLDFDNLSKDFYNENIDPNLLEPELVINPPEFFKMCQITTSLALESQIGRQLNIGVRDKTTGKWLGFIKLSSPILSLSSRNNLFDTQLRADVVNKYIINGSIILPTQPFGFNYLGGKLLALICISNEVRKMLKLKYPTMEPIFFETTSLWGSIKGMSQYNGLKPYIKSNGLTKSDSVLLYPTNEVLNPLKDLMRKEWGKSEWGGMLVNPKPCGPKLREYKKLLSIIKSEFKDDDYSKGLLKDINEWSKVPTQKGYYYSNYGVENWKDVILNNQTPHFSNDSKWDLDNLIKLWKTKSHKRWVSLNNDGGFRDKLEIWNEETCKLGRDIIR